MIPQPLNAFLNTINLSQQDTSAPNQFIGMHGPGFPPFLQAGNAIPSLQIDDGQDGLVMVLRQANPEVINELLLFMLDKNWLTPSSDLDDFMVGKNEKEEVRKSLPNPKLVQKRDLPNNGKNAVFHSRNPFLVSVNKVIEEHLGDEDFRPGCLSKKIFLCEMQLHRKLKKLANLSPANYVRKYRLQRSLSFLREKKLSVSEVCFRVGFRSLEYFSRSFKKEFGISPTGYMGGCGNSATEC